MLRSILITVLTIILIVESSTELVANEGDSDRSKENEHDVKNKKRITILNIDDLLNLKKSDIFGLGNFHGTNDIPRDMIDDGINSSPLAPDPSCIEEINDDSDGGECWSPPDSTLVEEEIVQECDDGSKSPRLETLPWGYGGADPDDNNQDQHKGEEEVECIEVDGETESEDGSDGCTKQYKARANKSGPGSREDDNAQCIAPKKKFIDKHWGSDINILKMRDQLRGRRGKYWDDVITEENTNTTEEQQNSAKSEEGKPSSTKDKRPPVFLLPGLASTRLVSWKHKPCPQSALLSPIKMLDYVWMNMNLLIQMATIDARCWNECMTLGKHQTDYDGDSEESGCKLRPDEGLDAISSLAPGSTVSSLFVGGTNTVYAWLIQWLADNLGYDVSSILALPYDWRLSPDVMESRDGFLTMTRRRIEAAVESNGRPGIMVAHSMGNSVFRYFLKWLRVQMREEAYMRYVKQAEQSSSTQTGASGGAAFWRRGALSKRFININKPGEAEDISEDNDDDIPEAIHDEDVNSATKQENQENNEDKRPNGRKFPQLYEIAKVEGDKQWLEWLGNHIWTYVGLAAPLLGAPGPLRSVLSGENMGLPFSDEEARILELSFGSTSTVNPISTKMGFCDGDENDTVGKVGSGNLACLEEMVSGIESSKSKDPWKEFPALRLILKDRVDFDSLFPTVRVETEYCEHDETPPCNNQTTINFGPREVMNGHIFNEFATIWNEKGSPLKVKLDQLSTSWWNTNGVPNMLETTPDRPHIKHVIMAYGTDVRTEVGYVYRKTTKELNTTEDKESFDGVPFISQVIVEEQNGKLIRESLNQTKSSFTEAILRKKKDTRRPLKTENGEIPTWLHHSGDGTIPYISLMWAHTWLLHARRAMSTLSSKEQISNPKNNALDTIKVTHRPKGGIEWVDGYGADPREEGEETLANGDKDDDDTGTSHPHGTRYKPKMVRFQSTGKSRSTGMQYTTTVIEAIGVEHKETTRNYDILAAAFTDVLNNLHNDYGL